MEMILIFMRKLIIYFTHYGIARSFAKDIKGSSTTVENKSFLNVREMIM